ncbi:TPA: hypothetical protein ACXLVU_000046 [Salmonella enterica]|nr:hypothetical protein [Salmonella enterica]
MGAFDTYVYNMQDPDDDCVAWKPELSKLLCDGQLLDVVIDAYQSARQRIAELEARTVAVKQFDDFQIVHYGGSEDYAKGYIDCQNNYNKALTAAGIGVEGE